MGNKLIKNSLILILILFSSGFVFGQSAYINNENGFGLKLPEGFQVSHVFDSEKYLQTYICPADACGVFGVFSIVKVGSVPKLTLQKAVRNFQDKDFLKYRENEFSTGSDERLNLTVLGSRYVVYRGRPGFRIDFNFISEDKSFTGSRIVIYLDDKHILVGLNSISFDSETDKWNAVSDKVVRSLTTNIQSLRPSPAAKQNIPTSSFKLPENYGAIRSSGDITKPGGIGSGLTACRSPQYFDRTADPGFDKVVAAKSTIVFEPGTSAQLETVDANTELRLISREPSGISYPVYDEATNIRGIVICSVVQPYYTNAETKDVFVASPTSENAPPEINIANKTDRLITLWIDYTKYEILAGTERRITIAPGSHSYVISARGMSAKTGNKIWKSGQRYQWTGRIVSKIKN